MTYGNYPNLDQVKKILVVKMRHHGDVLLTSPLFTYLKKALPSAEVHALIYKDTLPMLEGHGAISHFFLYDRKWKSLSFFKKVFKELVLFKEIRKQKYDLVINLTEGDRGALTALISGSPICVGFDPQDGGFLFKRKIYTHLVKPCRAPRHTVERQLDALRRIGLFPSLEERELSLHIPEPAYQVIHTILESNELRKNGYILIHPVSRWRFKCPPTSFTVELIKDLKKLGIPIILSAGPDSEEKALIDAIMADLEETDPVVNLSGLLTLKELSALIHLSKALICVDSVPLHIASALKTPVVALFGPSSDKNWGPWQHPKSAVIAKDLPCRPCFMDGCGGSKKSDCLYTLSPTQVTEKLTTLLDLRDCYGRCEC